MTGDGLAIGIDIGTSGARAVAMDRGGAVLAQASEAMPAPLTANGAIVQDAAVWWTAVCGVLESLSRDAALGTARSIAVDGTSGTIVAVDAGGEPLAPALMYNDPSAAETAKTFAALAPPETAALGATSPLARAVVLKETRGVARILHQADWIAGRLAGRFDTSDENNALKTGYDPVARRWPDWIARAGLDPALLPRVLPAGTAFGTLTAGIARRFGFTPGTAAVTGTTDGCAAFLATGAGQPGDGVTSLGTTLTVKLLSRTPVFAPRFGIYSHRIGDMWLAGGASNSGGAALLEHFSEERMRTLEAALRPDEPAGLDYYPLPRVGERFPVNDPDLEPRVSPRPREDWKFFQGLLEGVAAIEALGYRRLAGMGASPLRSMRTVGGGARNAAWMRIRQRALGVPFHPPAHGEAAAGTARLAWRGIGVTV